MSESCPLVQAVGMPGPRALRGSARRPGWYVRTPPAPHSARALRPNRRVARRARTHPGSMEHTSTYPCGGHARTQHAGWWGPTGFSGSVRPPGPSPHASSSQADPALLLPPAEARSIPRLEKTLGRGRLCSRCCCRRCPAPAPRGRAALSKWLGKSDQRSSRAASQAPFSRASGVFR